MWVVSPASPSWSARDAVGTPERASPRLAGPTSSSQVAADPEVIDSTSSAVVEQDLREHRPRVTSSRTSCPESLGIVSGAVTSRSRTRSRRGRRLAASTRRSRTPSPTSTRSAFDAAMKVIRDDGSEAVDTGSGAIELNVFPLIGAALTGLQDAGIIDASRRDPGPDRVPAQRRQRGQAGAGAGPRPARDLGTITLIESDRLAQRADGRAQLRRHHHRRCRCSRSLCVALALWLSQARLRMVLWLAIGAIGALTLGRSVHPDRGRGRHRRPARRRPRRDTVRAVVERLGRLADVVHLRPHRPSPWSSLVW